MKVRADYRKLLELQSVAMPSAAPNGAPPRRINYPPYPKKEDSLDIDSLAKSDSIKGQTDSLRSRRGKHISNMFFEGSRDLPHTVKRKTER